MNTECYIIPLCIGIVAVFIVAVEGQFPRLCTTDKALKNRECCPRFSAGGKSSKCGELQRRGSCASISTLPLPANEDVIVNLLLDERKEWPKVFYDRACICRGNFDGINCGKCKPGYQGNHCQEKKPILTRKNIKNMTKKEIGKFIEYVDKSKQTVSEKYVILTTSYDRIVAGEKPQFSNISVFDVFAWLHYYVARNNLVVPKEQLEKLNTDILTFSSPNNNLLRQVGNLIKYNSSILTINKTQDYAHEGPGFLPWHRYYLLKWEEDIRELIAKDDEFTIPYWDWRDSDTCDICTNSFIGARSEDNPSLISTESVFSRWEVICTKDDEYILNGRQCDGTVEGPLTRNYGAHDHSRIKGIPSRKDVENTQRFAKYETAPFNRLASGSFRNILEGFADPIDGEYHVGLNSMHNAVHIFMNGTMSKVASSGNDPLFVLHHAFIDSIYEDWLLDQTKSEVFSVFNENSNQEEEKVGQRLYDYMVPFFPLVRNIEGFQTSEELGFRYDYLDVDRGSGTGESDDYRNDRSTSFEEMENKSEDCHGSKEGTNRNNFIGEGNYAARGGEGSINRHDIKHKYIRRKSNNKGKPRQRFRPHLLGEGINLVANNQPIKSTEKVNENEQREVNQIRIPSNHFSQIRNQVNKIGQLRSSANQLSQIRQTGLKLPVDSGKEILTPWDRMVSYLQDWKRYAASVPQREIFLYVGLPSLMLAVTITAIALYCVLCTGKSKKKIKPNKGCCSTLRCCFNSKSKSQEYDDDEGQALLESYSDGKVKKKVVKATSYVRDYESDINPFSQSAHYKKMEQI